MLIALQLENLFKKKAKENQRKKRDGYQNSGNHKPIDTNKELAKLSGFSHDTISRVKYIAERATNEQIISEALIQSIFYNNFSITTIIVAIKKICIPQFFFESLCKIVSLVII